MKNYNKKQVYVMIAGLLLCAISAPAQASYGSSPVMRRVTKYAPKRYFSTFPNSYLMHHTMNAENLRCLEIHVLVSNWYKNLKVK